MNKSEVKISAKKVPAIMLIAGALICGILVIKSLSIAKGTFDYHSHVLSMQLYQAIMFICIECGIGAVWFEFLRIKKEENGS